MDFRTRHPGIIKVNQLKFVNAEGIFVDKDAVQVDAAVQNVFLVSDTERCQDVLRESCYESFSESPVWRKVLVVPQGLPSLVDFGDDLNIWQHG